MVFDTAIDTTMRDRFAGVPRNRATIGAAADIRRNVAFWPLRVIPWSFDTCAAGFRLDPDAGLVIDPAMADDSIAVAARLAGEWLHLIAAGVPVTLAGLAAARAAAQFVTAEGFAVSGWFNWLEPMAAELAPAPDRLGAVWHVMATRSPGAPNRLQKAAAERIIALWSILGSTESIMETGGDIRLLRDPQSDLNGYGCSHRPRPWAITFASSTASSVSERGYEAADRARLRITAALLAATDRVAIHAEAVAVRRAIGHCLGLKRGGAVVLAASGTDSELLALALSHLPAADRPITTILLAPEETGSGVPMAAVGHHFAVDTANGHAVSCATPIEGFRADTELVSVPLRDGAGRPRPIPDVDTDIEAAVTAAVTAGRRVILHALDLSKTGLLAPSMDLLRRLRARFGTAFDLVVDACQMRIAPARVRAYLDLEAVVQVTGSKFLTGPPFAGAALLPPTIARRLAAGRLPQGLDAYFSQGEWPPGVRAARGLPHGTNYGLVLRWRAALAEYRALAAVDDARKTMVIEQFAAAVHHSIDRHGIFILQPMPALARAGGGWDCLRGIFAFAVRAPDQPDRLLDPVSMRRLYHWLNADCASLFDEPDDRQLAARICHIGQPVALPDGFGGQTGWLRVSAGARLISGEPMHHGLAITRRLDREMADLATVFAKIALLRAHWDRVAAADPQPRYR